jgi:transcriptional regulator with XRE-family HTH domain
LKYKERSEKGNMDDFKITLRAARTNRGLTQKQAAELLGIHEITLFNYEKDSTNIPRNVFMQIEKAYGISLENIYFGKESDYFSQNFKEVMP